VPPLQKCLILGSTGDRNQGGDCPQFNHILVAKVLLIWENRYFVKGFITGNGHRKTLVKSADYTLFRNPRHLLDAAETFEFYNPMEITQKSENPAVSVIIPAFNRAWCLGETLQSVLDQTFKNFEMIVVDDGSTDGTATLLRQFPQVRVHRWEDNRGVSAARNQGIAMARGEWICFLDSDDRWLGTKLQVQVDWMQAHPECPACYTDEIWIRNGVRVNPKNKHRKYSGDIFRQCLPLCIISPSSIMMRASVLEEIGGFDTDLAACEDYDLWLRLASRYPVEFIPEKLIIKTGGHADQLSQKFRGMDRFRVYALEKILKQNALSPQQHAWVLEALIENCSILCIGYNNRGKHEEARLYEQAAEHYRRMLDCKGNEANATQPFEKEMLLHALED
jgi:glycosyltransferase involved in cell wall biosynthesis